MDLEYYTNRPISVKEQWAEQNQFPYIEDIPLFIGSNSEDKPNTFTMNTKSIDFDFLTLPNTIRVQLFAEYDIVSDKNIILNFEQIFLSYKLKYRYNIQNGKFYVLQRVVTNGSSGSVTSGSINIVSGSGSDETISGDLTMIDSETEPKDMKYQNFVIINKCIDAAILKSEKYIGYNIVTRHETIEATDKLMESYDEDSVVAYLDAELLRLSKFIPEKYYDQVIRNVEYKQNEAGQIDSLEYDYGFALETFPADLKRALHGLSDFYNKNRGELIVWGNQSSYKTFDADDITKNILIRYRGFKA